ncbi:hypothetical protein M9Y10_028229 [Tritrichomonas musculus]|uniref:Uncharacterized protein n=1 Tax=Tritrichomonas musculus TaxID=1915356 RepID=A0ABR2KIX4_9EUKA
MNENYSEISSDLSYSQTLEENENSAQFIPGSPVSSKSPISPISVNSQQALTTLVIDAVNQLRAVTLPNDKEQLQFLDSLYIQNTKSNINNSNISSPVNKISSLIDFLIEKVTSSSLEVTKMYKEMQNAKEESRISESKASRMLLHLQQNIKLLSRIATNNGDTTIAQEAALNVQSISNLEDAHIPPDYIRQLKQTLSNKKDPTAQVEVLELLKQEISINSILRKQMQTLSQTSDSLLKSIELIKAQVSNVSKKKVDKMKLQIKKQQAFNKQLCSLCGCEENQIIETIQKSAEQAKRNQASIELLSKKLQQMKTETETKISGLTDENSKLTNEINILKHQLSQYENIQKSAQKTRMKLCELLNIQTNPKQTEFEAITTAANQSIPILISYFNIQKKTDVDISNIADYIQELKDEVSKLKIDQEKKRALMEKQAATIAELQDKSWKNWGIDEISKSGSLVRDDDESKGSNTNKLNYNYSSVNSIHSMEGKENNEANSFSQSSSASSTKIKQRLKQKVPANRSTNSSSPSISKSNINSSKSNLDENSSYSNNLIGIDKDYIFNDDNDDESQFEQLNVLKHQFSSIEQELVKIQKAVDVDNSDNEV